MRTLSLIAAALVALFFTGLALAGELVMKNTETGAQMRLLDSQCSHGETLAVLAEQWRPKFKNMRILSAKGFIEFYGCWIQHDEETVVVVLSDGSQRSFRAAAFSDPTI